MSTFEGDLQRGTAVGLDIPAAPDAVVSWSPWLVWCAILAVGIGLRVALFSGYGLGDDANYFAAYYGVFKAGSWSEHVPYDFRF